MTDAERLAMNELMTGRTEPSPGSLPRQAVGYLGRHAGFVAVLVFAACFLSPMLWSGFYFDDVKNACTPGHLRLLDISVVKLFLDNTRSLMHSGRCFPGALGLTFLMHDVFTDAVAYKGCLLVLTLSNLIEFYYLLRCWKVNPPAAQLGTLALVLLMQMRAYADPLLGFAGIMQFVAGQLLLSMIFLQKHLESGRIRWLVASVTIFVSSLVTYEISYMFLPVYAAMAYAHLRQWRPALSAVCPHGFAAAVLAAFVLGLRFNVPMADDFPYRFNLIPGIVAATALKQASAALPLSYALLSIHHPLAFDGWRAVSRWDSWTMALFAGGLTWLLLRKAPGGQTAEKGPALGLLLAAGSLVWFLPGLPISASPKYQGCIYVGLGYLPVYVQYCGVALLMVAGMLWLARRFPAQRTRFALALILANAGVALFSFDTNRQVVNVLALGPNVREQPLVEAALDAGLGDPIPEGATIMSTKTTVLGVLRIGPPVSSSFVTQHLKRKVNAVSGVMWPRERPLSVQLKGLPLPTFILRCHSADGHSGYVLLGSIDPDTADLEEERFGTQMFRIFVRGTPSWPADGLAPNAVAGGLPVVRAENTGKSDEQRLDTPQLKLLRRGADWALYEGRLQQAVDVATVEISAVSAVLCRTGSFSEPR
jgi:hypothetical protein